MATALKTATVEFLTTTRIGEKGQLTVPKQFREDLGLGAGAPFTVLRMGDGLILIPEQRRFEELCRRVTTALRRAGIEPAAVLTSLPKARMRVFERHYGTLAPKTSGRHSHTGARDK
jgi:AbrB family looped-hinge helix DNA binding protein